MSAKTPSSAPSSQAKPRSPVERALVWGGILILLVLVLVEFTSRNAQHAAVASLVEKIKHFEGTENERTDLKSADVKAAVGNKVPRVEDVSGKQLMNGGKRLEVYEWFSINPLKKRAMYVYYGVGDDPDVLSVSTDEETETVDKRFPAPTTEQKEEMNRKAASGKKPAPPKDGAVKDDAAKDGAAKDGAAGNDAAAKEPAGASGATTPAEPGNK